MDAVKTFSTLIVYGKKFPTNQHSLNFVGVAVIRIGFLAIPQIVCPREEEYLLIIIGVILGIVAIGAALLLIWKLLATIQDRREFAKFEREQQNARWDTSENPIFKQATTTFQNPTYGGKS